jgi:polysaccharide export outer membrane protein
VLRDPVAPEAFISARGFSDDYEVGPGDQLEIQVVGYEQLRQSLQVSNSGELSVPMLGLVRVAGMTTFEIEDEIAGRLQKDGLVLKPEVLVSVQEYQAKPIYVMGAVTTPGRFIMSQALTSVDAILMAGGLRFNAGDVAFVHRRTSAQGASVSADALAANPGARPGVEVITIDMKPLKEGRFLDAASVPLQRGDVLVIPTQVLEQFFVVGEVLDPRNYLYVHAAGKPLMASQAISWAGGPTPTAKMSEGLLVRYDETGARTELKMDWGAIIRGKQPDFPIRPNDIIFVPGSAVKTITYGLLMLTGTMMQSTAFRIGRSYQMPDSPQDRPPQLPQ